MVLLPERFHLRIFLAVGCKHHVPGCLCLCLFLCQLCKVGIYLVRYEERLLIGPAQGLPHGLYIVHAQRLAVGAGLALLGRTAVTDLCFNGDEGRTFRICLCRLDGQTDGV